MSQLVSGGRPVARFRVLGFPVTIDISFVVVVALLGYYNGVTARSYVIWLVLVPLSVLVHELGHAVVARTTGARPVITLAGLGGLTSFVPPGRLSRARSVAISVAGPAVGIVIGGVLLAYGRTVGISSPFWSDVTNTTIFTTLGWSVLNLLPILPLDGGNTLRELLPGSPARRAVRAAAVSVVVAVLIGVAALRFGQVFGALMAAFLVFSNVMTVRSARAESKVDVNQRLVDLLWRGDGGGAVELLADQDPASGRADDRPAVHPFVRAAVLSAGPDEHARREAARVLDDALRATPVDVLAVRMTLLSLRAREDWAGARQLIASPLGDAADAAHVLAVQTAAFALGARRDSAELGDAYLARASPPLGDESSGGGGDDAAARAVIAYNSACGWVAVGEPDRGLDAFRRAAELGFDDLTMVDSDEDLAPLRPLPGYDEARSLIRTRALARTSAADDH